MEGFDPSTMTYMAPPSVPLSTIPDQNTFVKPSFVGLDTTDMYSNFDLSTFAGSEDFGYHTLQPQLQPGLRRMQSGPYDETAFSDVISHVETQANVEAQEPETTIDRDNKLLSFSSLSYNHLLLDYTFRQVSINLNAQLHGMFFLAESQWAPTNEQPAPPQNELTCYRRNLFQITGSVSMPRSLRCIMTDQGEQIPIMAQELTVSATESTEGNAVKIISVPWKTPLNPTQPQLPEDKTEKEPPVIPLDLMAVSDSEPGFAQFPIQWKRLQFRIATANNGRRKELQQHFVVRLKIMATLANGAKVCLCEARSGPVIVRGRSPRNFQARKDTPLNGGTSHARKSTTSAAAPPAQRTASSDSMAKANQAATSATMVPPTPVKTEVSKAAPSVQSFFDPNDFTANAETLYDGIMSSALQHNTAMTTVAQEPFSMDKHHNYAASSPDIARNPSKAKSAAAPINLSLVDEEPPRKRPSPDRTPKESNSSAVVTPLKRSFMPPPRPPSFSLNTVSTPDESCDLLYEYFPLGLDDWMPPVDAVYRPHVVHHIKVNTDPRDPNSAAVRGRSKRYFSEVAG